MALTTLQKGDGVAHNLSSFITENCEPILNEWEKHALHLAERVAIESYRQMIDYLGTHDSTTRRMLDTILASEK